jgi:superfamily II DNA or RNA helicase
MKMIKFKTRRWLEDDEFTDLMKVADYLGFENGYRVFALNAKKALQNGYTLSDVKRLVETLELEIEGSWSDAEKAFSAYSVTVDWDVSRGLVKIEYPFTVNTIVKSALALLPQEAKYARRVDSSKGTITLELLPYYARDFIAKLANLGLIIEDPRKILEPKPLAVKPELKSVTLRNYQEEALRAWLSNKCRGVIVLPTGAGKSIVAIAAIARTAVRTLIVVYTKEQAFQWRDFLLKYTTISPSMIGLFYAEEKRLSPITIITYQSGYRYINQISPYFDTIVVDEVHHLPAEKFKYIALHSLASYRMGLSATPEREDGKHVELFPLMGGIVYYKSPRDLVEQGYLAPYRVEVVKVKLSPDELIKYRYLRQLYQKYAKGRTFKEILEEARKGDPEAVEALRAYSEIRKLVANSKSKISRVVELATREYELGSKVIVFTQYIDQAREIAQKTRGLLLTGEMPEEERRRVLETFKQSSRGILVVTTVGDEGIDIPDANVGIIASGTGSRRQFIQRLGRLLRPKARGESARLYEIVVEKTSEEYQLKKRHGIVGESGDLQD